MTATRTELFRMPIPHGPEKGHVKNARTEKAKRLANWALNRKFVRMVGAYFRRRFLGAGYREIRLLGAKKRRRVRELRPTPSEAARRYAWESEELRFGRSQIKPRRSGDIGQG